MKSCLRVFGVIVVLLSAIALSSCEKDDNTVVDNLDGTVWYSLYTPDEYKTISPPSRGYALSFGKTTVVWATLDDNYKIKDIRAEMKYHLKGNTLIIANAKTDYNPNVIYVDGRTYVRQQDKTK